MYHKDYHVHNVSSSFLINIGCPELVSYSKKEYIEKAVELSRNTEKIKWYKNNIHTQFQKLMDPKTFMKDYEKLLCDVFTENIV